MGHAGHGKKVKKQSIMRGMAMCGSLRCGMARRRSDLGFLGAAMGESCRSAGEAVSADSTGVNLIRLSRQGGEIGKD